VVQLHVKEPNNCIMHPTLLLILLLFVVFPSLYALWQWARLLRGRQAGGKPGWATALNMGVLYALAYNTIFFLQELFLVLGKTWIGIDAVLYHNNHSYESNDPRAELMQGTGAAGIFLVGLLFLLLERSMKGGGWLRLLSLWLAMNGLLQSLPQFATSMMAPDTDTGQSLTYLGLNSGLAGYLVSISSFLLIFLLLIYFGRRTLRFAPLGESIRDRALYARQAILFGMLIGTVLIVPFRIPPFDRILSAVFLLLLTAPVMMAFSWQKGVVTTNSEVNQKFFWLPMALLILLLLFFQLVLVPGVVFKA
jgi:hypothetical protein